MAKLINLKNVRKQIARKDKEALANANRAYHGTPTALRKSEAENKARSDRNLDGHRLQPKNAQPDL